MFFNNLYAFYISNTIVFYDFNKKFNNKQTKLLSINPYISIVIYFFLLFTIDYSGAMDLYGQNVVRRVINMYRRTDPLNYENKLQPFCIKYEQLLGKKDIIQLQSIKIPHNTDIGILTRKNTTTHQCCEKYSKTEAEIIHNISEKVKLQYEEKIGKKLYYLAFNKATIYRYHGNKSHHLWHVDPQNRSDIYNVIICIKRKGNISPLQCKNKHGQPYSIHFDEGDAALFNGGTTVHQVPPNDDQDSERTVLSIAFTSSEAVNKNHNMSKNMCTFIEGGNNYRNIAKIIISIFLLNYVLTRVSGINTLSYPSLSLFFVFNLLLAKYLPTHLHKFGLGTGRSSSIAYNLVILCGFILATISIKGAILFLSYFLLSDMFLHKQWVEYD